MKKAVLSIPLFIFLTSFQEKEQEVFICPTKSSKAYHLTKNCRGLKRCSLQYEKISKKKAERFGRRMCKIELNKSAASKH